MVTFLKAWLFTVVLIIASIMACIHDVPGLIWRNDPTYISFSILGLGVVLIGRLLYLTYKFDTITNDFDFHVNDIHKDIGWLGSSIASRLGFLGTGIGMVMALGAFFDLDLGDPSSLQKVLENAFVGVMTALYTTIIGLVVNMVLSVYTFILGQAIRVKKLVTHDNTENTFPASA